MTIDENEFAVALRDLADQDPVTAPPTAQLLGRARRARRGRTTALTAAALAVVTMAGGGLAVGLDRRGPATTASATAAAASPEADSPAFQLVAAVQASAKTSFRFTMTAGEKKIAGPPQITGAYDPRVPKGYSIGANKVVEERLIGKDFYLRKGKGWTKFRATPGLVLAGDLTNTGPLNPLATVDFVKQIDTLKKAGTVKKTGPTSYSFSYSWKPGDIDKPAVIPISGTVQIDAKSGLVTSMAYTFTLAYKEVEVGTTSVAVRWTYTGYGKPVDVQVPRITPSIQLPK